MEDLIRHSIRACIACVAVLVTGADTARAQALIVESGGGDRLSLGVGEAHPLTSDSTGAVAQLKLIEHPGYRTPLHVHDQTDESFYVLQGVLTFHANGKSSILKAGDYVFIPRGTPHAQGNQTETAVTLLTTLAPAQFASFFSERAELVKTTPPNHADYPSQMRELGKRHDIRLVGPSPF